MEKGKEVGYSEALGAAAGNPEQPRTTGEPLVALGQTWTVAPCEQRIKAQFEQWVRRGAAEAIAEAVTDHEADRRRAAYVGDRGAGHYNWTGKWCRQALRDQPGQVQLLFLLLRRCHAKVTEEQADAMYEEDGEACQNVLRWALGNSSAPSSKEKTTEQKPNP